MNGPIMPVMGLRRGRIAPSDAEDFLESLADLNMNLVDPLSYDAVFKHGLTVYDAAYLDIASAGRSHECERGTHECVRHLMHLL
jgi:hypothetical protein